MKVDGAGCKAGLRLRVFAHTVANNWAKEGSRATLPQVTDHVKD